MKPGTRCVFFIFQAFALTQAFTIHSINIPFATLNQQLTWHQGPVNMTFSRCYRSIITLKSASYDCCTRMELEPVNCTDQCSPDGRKTCTSVDSNILFYPKSETDVKSCTASSILIIECLALKCTWSDKSYAPGEQVKQPCTPRSDSSGIVVATCDVTGMWTKGICEGPTTKPEIQSTRGPTTGSTEHKSSARDPPTIHSTSSLTPLITVSRQISVTPPVTSTTILSSSTELSKQTPTQTFATKIQRKSTFAEVKGYSTLRPTRHSFVTQGEPTDELNITGPTLPSTTVDVFAMSFTNRTISVPSNSTDLLSKSEKEALITFLAVFGCAMLVILTLVCGFFFRKKRSKHSMSTVASEYWHDHNYDNMSVNHSGLCPSNSGSLSINPMYSSNAKSQHPGIYKKTSSLTLGERPSTKQGIVDIPRDPLHTYKNAAYNSDIGSSTGSSPEMVSSRDRSPVDTQLPTRFQDSFTYKRNCQFLSGKQQHKYAEWDPKTPNSFKPKEKTRKNSAYGKRASERPPTPDYQENGYSRDHHASHDRRTKDLYAEINYKKKMYPYIDNGTAYESDA